MTDYQKLYNASRTNNQIKEKRYRKMNRLDIWKKRLGTLVIITGIAVSANMGHETYNMLKSYNEKVTLKHEATQEMIEVGYPAIPEPDGNWNENYHMIKDIDLIKIYALTGSDNTEQVLRARGYEGWDEFLTKEGFENQVDWREAELEKIREEEDKKR